MKSLRLAVIGGGQIAAFHAPAFRAAGFDLVAVCSSPGSSRVGQFAKHHHIPSVFDGVSRLFDARKEWDALLISVPTEVAPGILKQAVETQAPILVEKPVAYRSEDLLPFLHQDLPVIVGYNRRFYRTVQLARAETTKEPRVFAYLCIPESIQTPSDSTDDATYLKPFFTNSVHGLDLARFIFGQMNVKYVQRLINKFGHIWGLTATLAGQDRSVLQLTANWGTPATFSLTIDRPGRRLELRPFEQVTVYEGLEVREPSEETPMRIYTPKVVERVSLDNIDYRYKPGFVAQAKALGALVCGEDPGPAARLQDAFDVLQLAEQLVGLSISNS